MKKKWFWLVIPVLVLSGLMSCTKSNTDIVYNRKYIDEIKEARKDLHFHLIQNMVPGANVAVSINNEIVYSEAMGWASKDLEVPAKRSTKFRVADISSLFTNAIYLKMTEEGIINPDSSVQHYFPGFPDKIAKVTVKMLVNEISGIRPPYADEEMKLVNTSIEKGINLFKDDPLDMPPGEFQIHSSYNHNLLGVVLEKASGKNFATLLKEYVTDTLNLNTTISDNPFATIIGRSDFYESNVLQQVIHTTFYDLRPNAPSKGLLSSAEDLVRLGNAYLEGNFFSEETRQTLFEPLRLYNNNTSRMVNGWFVYRDTFGRTVYSIETSVVGGTAALLIYPEEKLVAAYACNLTSALDETPVFIIANNFVESPDKKEQPRSKLK